MTVAELEKSIDFYCDLFNGEVTWRGVAMNMTKTVPAAHVRLDDRTYISMFEKECGDRAPYDYGPPGVNHVGIVVDDLVQTRDRLQQLGVAIEKEADYEPGHRLYVFDPNGIELELVYYEPSQ